MDRNITTVLYGYLTVTDPAASASSRERRTANRRVQPCAVLRLPRSMQKNEGATHLGTAKA